MGIKDNLELKQVLIKSDTEKIQLQGFGKVTKKIKITTNCANEKINCTAVATNNIIKFNRYEFETDFVLEIDVDLKNRIFGDEIDATIKILTKSNDLNIPINIKVTKPYLESNNKKLYVLKDFYDYLIEDEYNAMVLFLREEFKTWIKSLDLKYFLSYELLKEDENTRRRIENFLCLNDVKKRVTLAFESDAEKIFFSANAEKIEKFIDVKKIGSGYFEYDLLKENNLEILKFEQDKLTSDNFIENKNYKLKYTLDLKNNFEKNFSESISFKSNDSKLNLEFIKMPITKICKQKDLYKNGEIGYFEVENNFGEEIDLVIIADDLILKEESYKFKKKQKIIFTIDAKTNKQNVFADYFTEIKVLAITEKAQEEKRLKFKIDLT